MPRTVPRLAMALVVAGAALMHACDRIVDLTPLDSGTGPDSGGIPDAGAAGPDSGGIPDAGAAEPDSAFPSFPDGGVAPDAAIGVPDGGFFPAPDASPDAFSSEPDAAALAPGADLAVHPSHAR